MTRIPFLVLSLAGLGALPAAGQSPVRKPDITKQLLGTWEGPYSSEAVPPGTLKLVVAQGEKQEWKATLEIMSDQPPGAGDLREFTVDGNVVSWVQTVADLECRSTATLETGVLKGTAECSQGGVVVVTAAFLLAKKA